MLYGENRPSYHYQSSTSMKLAKLLLCLVDFIFRFHLIYKNQNYQYSKHDKDENI